MSFEGIDGAGKTTQIGRLVGFLEQRGRHVRVFREPGGTELGERIRELVLADHDVVPWAEASLFAAARAQLVEREIRPALAAGIDVICDRYADSSVAYQGGGRGLGIDAVRGWNIHVTGGLVPDLTFLLALTARAASARIEGSMTAAAHRNPPDRLDRESLEFRESVAEAYRELARRSPERFVTLDADLSADAIAERIAARIHSTLAARLHAQTA